MQRNVLARSKGEPGDEQPYVFLYQGYRKGHFCQKYLKMDEKLEFTLNVLLCSLVCVLIFFQTLSLWGVLCSSRSQVNWR